ncbi:MAG TPA: hypothetical protein VGY32_10930, partial [Solirubrobacteraceae bacterium]|nr:hypothetical protein [Solirubrobacteraceae bacterium]
MTATTSPPAPPPTVRPPRRELPSWLGLRVVVGAAGLLVLALIIVLWARTRPGFDPYGWLVWGHQTLLGALDTNAAPSWKPLPFLFTVPFAIFGHYELWLWMITCVAISLGGALAAGHIVYRLVRLGTAEGDSRAPYVAAFAGVFATVGVLEIRDWWHYMLSAQSDTMIVALSLAAIDAHLTKRPRLAFILGSLAALGRPEVWPFLGLYAIWAWLRVPRMRWLLMAGVAAIAFLWLGIPAITSRSPFVAGANAFGSGRRLKSDRVFGTIDRFLDLHETGLEIAALLSLAVAALRRDLVTLVIGAGVIGWVIVEVAFSLHGWPGLGRYMFPAAGAMVVVAGVLVGRLLTELPALAGRLRPAAGPAAGWTGLILALALGVSLIPAAVSRGRDERRDLRVQRARTKEINRLSAVITRYGGAAHLRA